MTSTKKAAPRKRRPVARTQSKPADNLNRFLKALVLFAITSFGAASYVLNPQWGPQLSPAEILGRLGGRSQERVVPVAAPTGPLVHTRFTECPQFFPGASLPAVPASQGLRELCFSAFAILHNDQTKTPVFVAERLNRKLLVQAQGLQRTDKFYAEARLPKASRAELDDYRGSGYSRGHMAPAGDMYSKETMAQSFSLANMVPQDQTHNAGPWSHIEQDTRKYAMRAAGDVFVFTGPFYGDKPKRIGVGVAVPSHIYKVVYDATTKRSWVHWQANSASTRAGEPITYAEFVRRTGMQLLPSTGN